MAISPTSRYAAAVIDTVDDPLRGTHQEVVVPPPVDHSITFTYYQVVAGDTVDNLAFANFGDGKLWWMIADTNPEILDWNLLKPGQVIRIPNA